MSWCIFLLTLILVAVKSIAQSNNVCKTFPDYYLDLNNNENCYYNPDINLLVPDIIRGRGYPVEAYSVTTTDGYILTVFRIPYGKNSVNQTAGPPVFMQHGIALNCAGFVDIARNSLGFILADAGYDVWLGNFRGNIYSSNHTTLSSSSRKYWDFSFHENGIYDLPAQLDLIYGITQQKITYIGFSMGTTAAYIYSSTFPDLAFERIRINISLAPIAFLKHIKTVLRFGIPLWRYLEPPLDALTGGVLQLRQTELTKLMCLPYPFQMRLCETSQMILFGFDYEQNDPETLPVTLVQNIDAVSIKTISHFNQLVQSGKFQNFDYGVRGNVLKYGSPATPQYDLTKIRVPVYLVRGNNDLLATKQNVEQLYAALPQQAKPYEIYLVPYKKFMHSDFLQAKDIVPLLYNHLVDFIRSLQ